MNSDTFKILICPLVVKFKYYVVIQSELSDIFIGQYKLESMISIPVCQPGGFQNLHYNDGKQFNPTYKIIFLTRIFKMTTWWCILMNLIF